MKITQEESSSRKELLAKLREAYCAVQLEYPDWEETLEAALLSAAYGNTDEENGYLRSSFKIEEAREQMETLVLLLKEAEVANQKVLEDYDIIVSNIN